MSQIKVLAGLVSGKELLPGSEWAVVAEGKRALFGASSFKCLF